MSGKAESPIPTLRGIVNPTNKTELFCNCIAAEVLAPPTAFIEVWKKSKHSSEVVDKVARHFKVSKTVTARRAQDLGLIDEKAYYTYFKSLQHRGLPSKKKKGGGDFWRNQKYRIGTRFGTEVIRAVNEGTLLHKHAYELTGLKGRTFRTFVEKWAELT